MIAIIDYDKNSEICQINDLETTKTSIKDDIKFNIGEPFLNDDTLIKLLNKYKELFDTQNGKLRTTNLLEHTIELLPNIMPIRCKPYPLNPESKLILRKEIDDLLQKGIIQPSVSQFSSPIIIVKKKKLLKRRIFQ